MERKIKYKGKNRILVLSGDYFWREIKRKQATSINIQYISQLHNQKLRIKVKASFKSKIPVQKTIIHTKKSHWFYFIYFITIDSVLRNYSWAMLRGLYEMLGVEPGLALCKSKALPTILLLWHHHHHFLSEFLFINWIMGTRNSTKVKT